MSRIVCPSTRYSLRGLKQDLGSAHLRSLSLSDKGCVLYLPLNSLPNGISPDLSGKGNNGVNHGTALVDIGEKYPLFWKNKLIDIGGKAISFDGVDDYVDCGNSASLDITDAITIEVWIKPNANVLDGLAHEITRKTDAYFLRIISNKVNAQLWRGGSTVKDGGVSGTTSLQAEKWYLVGFTFDGSYIRIFLNGNLDNTPYYTPGTIDTSIDPLYIGTAGGSAEFFSGLIDEVRIYNRALSPVEIKAHFDLTRVLFGV